MKITDGIISFEKENKADIYLIPKDNADLIEKALHQYYRNKLYAKKSAREKSEKSGKKQKKKSDDSDLPVYGNRLGYKISEDEWKLLYKKIEKDCTEVKNNIKKKKNVSMKEEEILKQFIDETYQKQKGEKTYLDGLIETYKEWREENNMSQLSDDSQKNIKKTMAVLGYNWERDSKGVYFDGLSLPNEKDRDSKSKSPYSSERSGTDSSN